MKPNSIKTSLLLIAGVFTANGLFAQGPDSTKAKPAVDTIKAQPNDYVQPFSGDGAFRTWSVRLNVGVMSTNTAFTSNDKLDFTSPNARIGYGGYIKKQVFHSFGIQADF